MYSIYIVESKDVLYVHAYLLTRTKKKAQGHGNEEKRKEAKKPKKKGSKVVHVHTGYATSQSFYISLHSISTQVYFIKLYVEADAAAVQCCMYGNVHTCIVHNINHYEYHTYKYEHVHTCITST